jgi:CO/xanthine dehydrogenase FAD-binding subunit
VALLAAGTAHAELRTGHHANALSNNPKCVRLTREDGKDFTVRAATVVDIKHRQRRRNRRVGVFVGGPAHRRWRESRAGARAGARLVAP